MTSADTELQKHSVSDSPIPRGSHQVGHMLLNVLTLSALSIVIFFFWGTIEQLFQSMLVLALGVFGVPTTTLFSSGVDVDAVSAFVLFLLLTTIIGSAVLQQKAQGFIQAMAYSMLTIFALYIIFIYFGPRLIDEVWIGWINSDFFLLSLIVVAFFYGGIFTVKDSEIPQRESKILEINFILIFLTFTGLFLISSTAAALDFRDRVSDGTDDIQDSSNTLTNYFQCQVFAGEIRGSAACVNATEEKEVERVSEDERLTFEFREDTFSSQIDENFRDSEFTFTVNPAQNRQSKLLYYECRVGDNVSRYEIPTEYQQLTQSFPQRTFNIQLDCPVADVVDKSKNQENVKIKIFLEVEDRIIQNIPYVDCSNEYFTNNVDDFISCGTIVDNYYNSQINNNPSSLVDELFSTFNDDVRGSATMDTTIQALRGFLPLKLNYDGFDSINSFRYDVLFEEERNLNINSIQINNIETPQYISVNSQTSISEPINFSDSNSKKLVPIRFDINSFSSGQVGGVEAMVINYKAKHYIEQQQRVQLRLEPDPEPEEEDTSEDNIIVGEDTSEEDTTSQDSEEETNEEDSQTDTEEETQVASNDDEDQENGFEQNPMVG
ncbi:MAG: hypothetical protein ACLFPL_01440 [Candidatus Nanoarchaeia archaeon]